MISRIEMLKIALAHAQGDTCFSGHKRPRYRDGYELDLIGLFIPASVYFATPGIESMTTYQLHYAGIFDEEQLRFINLMDDIQTRDTDKWVAEIKRRIDDERKANH